MTGSGNRLDCRTRLITQAVVCDRPDDGGASRSLIA
jgi:hypothetical protein